MGDALPIGAITLATAACPTGYTRVSALDGRYLVSDATYNAAAGGAASHSHANISHTHSMTLTTAADGSLISNGTDSVSVGQTSSHTHSISGTSTSTAVSVPSQTVDPTYATVILCKRTS